MVGSEVVQSMSDSSLLYQSVIDLIFMMEFRPDS